MIGHFKPQNAAPKVLRCVFWIDGHLEPVMHSGSLSVVAIKDDIYYIEGKSDVGYKLNVDLFYNELDAAAELTKRRNSR